MPKRPVSGTKMVAMELPVELTEEAKAFAKGRGEAFKDVVALALRRHLDNPPPPPEPAKVPPLPPLPAVEAVKGKDEPAPNKPAAKSGRKAK